MFIFFPRKSRPYSMLTFYLFLCLALFPGEITSVKTSLPSFRKLKLQYPGRKHFGGKYTHKELLYTIGVERQDVFPKDTGALRLSSALNKLGPPHSLGWSVIRLSNRNGDSVAGRNGLQYMYNSIAFGPYLAEKYGDPNISVLRYLTSGAMKKKYLGKQGILLIVTYSRKGNKPKGHIALWDCDHFHESNDWIEKHILITATFWESPDSYCNLSI